MSALVLGALLSLSAGCSSTRAGAGDSTSTGQARHFTVTRLDGKREDPVVASRGHLVLVDIWATWCPPCREELPVLARISRLDHDLRIVAVDQGEDRKRVAAAAAALKLPFPVYIDPEQLYGGAYATVGLPTAVLIRPDGTIAVTIAGSEDYASWRKIIARAQLPAKR